jgi:hypothetical protein
VKCEQFQWLNGAGGWNPAAPGEKLGRSAQLVLVFGNATPGKAEGLEAIRSAYPQAHVVGCTTGGEIAGSTVRDETLCGTAVAFEHTQVVARSVTVPAGDDSYEAGAQLARSFEPAGLRHVFLLADGLKLGWSELVAGVAAALPAGVSASGGFAADGGLLQLTHVWCDSAPQERTAAALGFYGDRLKVGVAASGLWGPFGPDRLVTKSVKNVLYELDGRAALGLFKQYLGEHAKSLPASGLMFPLDVRLHPSGNRVLRSLIQIDESQQSVICAGNVPEGSHARLMTGNIEDLIDGTFSAARASLGGMSSVTPQLSVLVSCYGRRIVLKQRVEEEVEAVREVIGEAAAVTGFYSYGEVAPLALGGLPELHNETMTITNFAEA